MNLAAYGKIAGGLGLLVLLSAPYTFFITTGSGWMALAKLGVGLTLFGVYLGTNWKHFGQFASRKSTYYVLFSGITAVFLVGALAAVNYVAWKKNVRWDLTDKKIHSLAPQTVTTLQKLEQKVEATAFFPAEHPEYEGVDRQLDRYRREAPEKFSYGFKDPKKYPDLAKKYELREGRPTVILSRGEGDSQSHVPVHRFSEQDLTNALLRLSTSADQKAYFTVGHDEWPLQPAPESPGASLAQLARSLQQEGYVAEPLSLVGLQEVPRDAALVVVAGARTRFTAPEEDVLTRYLAEGGRMIVFAEALVEGGLDGLLAKYGVQIDNGVLADAQFVISGPYDLISIFYGEHEITERHRRAQLNVQMPTARGLTVLREGMLPGVITQPVVLTSPYAWVETDPTPKPQQDDGEKAGQIPMVVSAQRVIPASDTRRHDEARLVVFGDSDLVLDGNWGLEPNRNLVLNTFAWATVQSNKVTIRPPDRDVSTLDLDQDLLTKIHFTATDLLPLLLLGVGLAIWQSRRNK